MGWKGGKWRKNQGKNRREKRKKNIKREKKKTPEKGSTFEVGTC